jgi:membrane-associated protease RseP (regulator of RpoE activity)
VNSHDPQSFSGPGGPATGAFPQAPGRLWLHLLLLGATLISTTFCGGLYFGWLDSPDVFERGTNPLLLFEGLKFSVPLLLILGAHEMGHLWAARSHRLRATLPYFLPMPIPFPYSPGTLGAVIRIQEPVRTRRQLMDVGAAGPIAGFVITVPLLLIGLGLSEVQQVDPEQPLVYFGEPLIFRLLARGLFFPALGPTEDIFLHPTAWAAWFGLLVTALNMLPFSQLDGGHVGYALFGRWHRHGVWLLLGALIGLGFLWPGWWMWSLIVTVLGVRHPPVIDEDRALDRRRRLIGWLAFAIFALSFAPVPVEIVLP